MDFAPYQDQSPETNRALSPPPQEGRRSISPAGPVTSPPLSPIHASQPSSNPWDANGDSSTRAFGSDGIHGLGTADIDGGRGGLNEFETSLPIRLDYAASLAYLVIPPAGGVLLLVLEHKSDYVRWVYEEGRSQSVVRMVLIEIRFHAWQSALVFTSLFVLHLILSWSPFLSWTLLVFDLALIGQLTFRAYRDGKFCGK
jgi:uncharacterized membrane protein